MNKITKALDRKIVLRASVVDMALGGVIFALNLFLATIGTSKFIADGYGNKYGITPKTFPRAVFIAACILSVLMIIRGFTEFKKKKENEKKVQFHLISLAIFLDMVLFVFTLIPLGYPVANLLMMTIMYWLSGGKKWWKCIVVAVVFTVISGLFFHTYLKIQLPAGILSGILK